MAEFELSSVETKQNIQKKQNVVKKEQVKVGNVAHFHPRENAEETWDEGCLYIDHYVRDPAGLIINDTLYKGSVVVPTCVANYLTQMEQAAELAEISLFRSGSINRVVNQN